VGVSDTVYLRHFRRGWLTRIALRLPRLALAVTVARRPAGPGVARAAGAAALLRVSVVHAQTRRSGQVMSGQVRFITRPKSRTMRATRQLVLPPSTVS
jgi:hypothetical protein